jgi:hypothetical protein
VNQRNPIDRGFNRSDSISVTGIAAIAGGAPTPREEPVVSSISRAAAALAVLLLAACATEPATSPPVAPPLASAPGSRYAVIPANKDSDVKLYRADGRIASGPAALGAMQREAQVVLWLAGNQFFAMDDVVRAFQKQNAGISVGLITLPPGLLLEAIEKGGWVYGGTEYPGLPDVYASVNLGHLQKLKTLGLANRFAVYMHNEMVLLEMALIALPLAFIAVTVTTFALLRGLLHRGVRTNAVQDRATRGSRQSGAYSLRRPHLSRLPAL